MQGITPFKLKPMLNGFKTKKKKALGFIPFISFIPVEGFRFVRLYPLLSVAKGFIAINSP